MSKGELKPNSSLLKVAKSYQTLMWFSFNKNGKNKDIFMKFSPDCCAVAKEQNHEKIKKIIFFRFLVY